MCRRKNVTEAKSMLNLLRIHFSCFISAEAILYSRFNSQPLIWLSLMQLCTCIWLRGQKTYSTFVLSYLFFIFYTYTYIRNNNKWCQEIIWPWLSSILTLTSSDSILATLIFNPRTQSLRRRLTENGRRMIF